MQIKLLSKCIVNWYNFNKRDLPFRLTKNPYKIWLSEVMLQQTKVNTVVPYYEKWIKHFPTLKSVALANFDDLLKLWEGLGYYNRCKNFHKATKIVLKHYDGMIPNTFEQFISLPGVGDYTAGAVLSIAFQKTFPAIDGNVVRVLSRLLGIKNLTKRNLRRIKNTVISAIPPKNPGDFNQGLMELGATICLPKNPKCAGCPIISNCKAYERKKENIYPILQKKGKNPHISVVAGIIWRKKTFYIQKRKMNSMLGGLWEFPGGKVKNGETLQNALKRELIEECGFEPKIIKEIDPIKHSYSHFSITFHCFYCIENKTLLLPRKASAWITVDEIKLYSFPKANHKLFKLLSKYDWFI